MALTGTNGDNETHINTSQSLDYSLYDENVNQIQVENLRTPLELWISKDTSVSIEPFQLVNASAPNASNVSLNGGQFINGLLVNGFTLSGSNISIHIQIKPLQKERGYLSLLKFGSNPTTSSYDVLNEFCSNNFLINENNEEYYLTFVNMTTVNGFKGYVGYSIVEIDCSSNLTTLDLLANINQNSTCFTHSFFQRVFTSGCYYMNTNTNEWSSYGMEILADSNVTHTHCKSTHLTSFAGGFIVLPNAINFNEAFSHASFVQNPVIYSTVIALVCLYILLGVWARWMDRKDDQKCGITFLGACDDFVKPNNKYFYEIIVFTGNRPNGGTTSKVYF